MIAPGAIRIAAATGLEVVTVDNGSAVITTLTTQQIADLAAGTSNNAQVTALNTVGAGTVTAAGIIGGITSRGGAQSATAFADTTATAALIIAALPAGALVGTTFVWRYENTTDGAATLGGGTGVTLSGNVIVPKLTWADYLVTYSAAATVTMAFIGGGQLCPLPFSKLATQAITTGVTFTVGGICGAQISNLTLTSATAQAVNLALPPATELFAAIPNCAVGLNYELIIRNAFTTTSIATITGSATGVTLSGTATIAQNASGIFNISIDSATTYTATRVGP